MAATFQQHDFHVFATARDPSKMRDLEGLPNVTFLTLDIVKPDHIKAAVEAVTKHTGGKGTLDYLVSNAGRNHFMPILDEDLDTVRGLFEINFFGPIALTQAFAPLLREAKGLAVYIASTSGYLNIPYMGTWRWRRVLHSLFLSLTLALTSDYQGHMRRQRDLLKLSLTLCASSWARSALVCLKLLQAQSSPRVRPILVTSNCPNNRYV